jgi:hypothetical protein
MKTALSLLVLGAVVLAGCSGGGTHKAAPVGTTTTLEGARTPSTTSTTLPKPTLSLKNFTSPSGNIGCVVDTTSARCDVRDHVYTAGLRPSNCDLDWGDSLQVNDKGLVGWVCHGDTVFDPAAQALPYGKSSQKGSIVCASADTGMTCTQGPSGHGFLISRERYRIF